MDEIASALSKADAGRMSPAQLKRVNSLAVVSDSAITGPGSVLRMLDQVRLDRGLMYAACG